MNVIIAFTVRTSALQEFNLTRCYCPDMKFVMFRSRPFRDAHHISHYLCPVNIVNGEDNVFVQCLSVCLSLY